MAKVITNGSVEGQRRLPVHAVFSFSCVLVFATPGSHRSERATNTFTANFNHEQSSPRGAHDTRCRYLAIVDLRSIVADQTELARRRTRTVITRRCHQSPAAEQSLDPFCSGRTAQRNRLHATGPFGTPAKHL